MSNQISAVSVGMISKFAFNRFETKHISLNYTTFPFSLGK